MELVLNGNLEDVRKLIFNNLNLDDLFWTAKVNSLFSKEITTSTSEEIGRRYLPYGADPTKERDWKDWGSNVQDFLDMFCSKKPKIVMPDPGYYICYKDWTFYSDVKNSDFQEFGPSLNLENFRCRWNPKPAITSTSFDACLMIASHPYLKHTTPFSGLSPKILDGYSIFKGDDPGTVIATIGSQYHEINLEGDLKDSIKISNDPTEGRLFSRGDVHILLKNPSNEIVRIFGTTQPASLPDCLDVLPQQLEASHPFLMYRESGEINIWNTDTGKIVKVPAKEFDAASIAVSGSGKACVTTVEKKKHKVVFKTWKESTLLREHSFKTDLRKTLDIGLQTFIFGDNLFGLLVLNEKNRSKLIGLNITSTPQFLWACFEKPKLDLDSNSLIEVFRDSKGLPEIHINKGTTLTKKIIGLNPAFF